MRERIAGVQHDGLTEFCSANGQFHSNQTFKRPCEV